MNTNNNTTTDAPKVNKYFNPVEAINLDLVENNIECSTDYRWIHNGNEINVTALINHLIVYRATLNKKSIAKEFIAVLLSDKENKIKGEIIAKFKPTIKFNPLAKDTFEELARMISQDKYHSMYPIILKHIVWTVKRRIYGLSDYNPIFLNIYGDAGAGKTQFLRAFFSVIPDCLIDNVKLASDLFNDERQAFRFNEAFVMTMDELTGLNKTDMNKLKNQIDSDKVAYRVLGYNKIATGRNNAQLIGSSNTRLQNTLFTDADLRKWCELDMYKYPDNLVSDKMVKPLIDYDWLNLWQSVNENESSPFENADTYQAFREWTQAKCLTETPTVEFIKDYITDNEGKFKPIKEIWQSYTNAVNDKYMSKSKLKELIEKNGFQWKHTNLCNGYLVPTRNQCRYFTKEEKTTTLDEAFNN